MKPEARARRAEPSHFALWAGAMLPAIGLCVFAPLGILQTNAGEFDSTPPALLPVLSLTGLGLGAVLALVGHALPRVWRLRWTSLLFVAGLLLWLQGAFLMHDYGLLDGRGMRFEGFGVLVSADLLLWLAALAGALVFAPRLAPIAGFGATVFIVLQAMPLAAFLLSFEGEPEEDGPLIPPHVLEYSSTRNIVHVVFDNFQTDVFEQILDEQGLRERFDGFTLFGNNLAVAPHTSLAVPAIFSGRPFDGRLPADEYYQRAIADGFHTRLLDHGMAVNLLPLMSMREGGFTHYFEPPRIYGVTERQRLLQEAVKLIDIALFRQLPHMTRPWVYNDNRWRLSRLLPFTRGGKGYQHRRFLADYIAGIRIAGEGPAYHYVHIWSPHPPFTTLADGRPARAALANTRENYLNEARPTVALMIAWIERLNMLGIYDDSLVIFQSDHGGGYEPDFMPTRSLALLAVKPPGQSGPMRVSDSPSTVADVAATVLDEAGIDDPAFPGPSLVSLAEADRVRRFVFRHEGDFHVTEVRGHVADPASYAPPRPLDTVQGSRRYVYGETVLAGLVGEGSRYIGDGWATSEDRHVWSNGPQASLLMKVPAPSSDLELSLTFMPHVDPDVLPEQAIEVQVNGRLLASWNETTPGRKTVHLDIPREWVTGPDLEIRLNLPLAASPAELGTGGDRRELGIALIGFRLAEKRPRQTG